MTLSESLRGRADQALLRVLHAVGEGAPNLEEKLRLLEIHRASWPPGQSQLERLLVQDIEQLAGSLRHAQEAIGKLKELFDQITAPPWRVGVFLCPVERPDGLRAMVDYQGTRVVVGLMEAVSLADLALGDEVYLSNDLTALAGKCEAGVLHVGETAAFDRRLADGRLVLRSRDEELVVDAAPCLAIDQLRPGDHVRFDRRTWIAYERLEQTAGRRFLLEEVPDVGVNQVGGQRRALAQLLSALTIRLVERKRAGEYGLTGRQAILLEGPPGCGKTLMARVAAAEVRRHSGRSCKFAVVKPAEWEDPYVGVTQQNIRNCFRMLREAAAEGFAVLFLDEIEAIGRHRGSAVGHHSDKFLAALLAEIDGFEDRTDVAIIAATNRKDLCDAALISRFDVEITVPRPDMRGAREIFEIHLPASRPFSPNSDSATDTRRQIIERAVARLYSPNGDNEVCEIRFRDGSRRVVRGGELMSGRAIEQICREACQAAFLREVQSGQGGVRCEDMDEAVDATLERFSNMLTRYNAHAYLSDLPQDLDVVAVEPLRRRTRHLHRYLRTS